MDKELRATMWRRDKNTCQVCGKQLTETVTIYPEKSPPSIEYVPIYKWNRPCYKCGKETPRVSYDLDYDVSYNIGDVEKLDNLLMQNYPFVKRTYSETQEREVVANTCIHCGSLQGNWYIVDELMDIIAETQDIDKLVDLVLRTTLASEDLGSGKPENEKPYPAEVMVAIGEIHHKDGNWQNDDPQNLILICKNCHAKIKPVHGTARPRRISKEKREADRWRENYYALKEQQMKKASQ